MIKLFEQDPYAPIQYVYEVSNLLYKGKSEFQEIMVLENPFFGRILVLDNVVQLTEKDEFFYHEMLAHVVMHSHPDPKTVVVIGGGDGGTLREVMRHKTVEKAYFIEIDKEVIEVSKRFFPELASGMDDPRVEIKPMDGADFVKSKKNEIDIVIVDSTDIVGFAKSLFTKEFFDTVSNCLRDDGMFVTLSESLHFHKDIVIEVQETMAGSFPVVDLYTVPLATYAGNWWTFSAASKKLGIREMRRKFDLQTRYYTDEIHQNAFLPVGFYEKLLQRKLKW